MSYATLDKIADSFIPVLGFFSALSVILGLRCTVSSIRKAGYRFIQLLLLVLIVYLLMFIDRSFGIWNKFGGMDYSTHTALSMVLTLFLANAHKKYRPLLLLSFTAYLLLMLYQRYHTVPDIVSTAFIVGLLSLGLLQVTKKFS